MSPRKKTPRKKTGGGAFDPAARPLYFAAGNGSDHFPKHILKAVNDLWTPAAEKELVAFLDDGYTVLLDSGIFWLTNEHKRAHGCSMDEALALPPEEIDGFERLYERYVELVQRYGDRLWGYIELDQGGAVNKRRTRARLESDGLAPIPVYHPLVDGWGYFDELAAQYDRICFGNIVQARPPVRLRLLHTLWERHRAYPDLWVHVLGLTANHWCLPIPPDSCDSSSWLAPLRWQKATGESSMMATIGGLVDGFRYVRGGGDGSMSDAGRACADAVTSIGRVWAHAQGRLEELIGPPMPPYRRREGRPRAAG